VAVQSFQQCDPTSTTSRTSLLNRVPFYEGFFMEGWTFFYKLSLQLICSIEDEINQLNDCGDIYISLKLGKNDEGRNDEQYNKKWEEILSSAFNFDEMKF
jgi:hypothetical protein